MISKKEILSSINDEIKIIKHLGSKIKEEHLTYQPSEKQRTVLQLLQYLSYCGLGSATVVINGNRDHGKAMSENSLKVNLGNFAAAMDEQMVKIENLLKDFDDKALSERDASMPWGVSQKAGAAIVNKSLKFLVGYRMQLFLYLKDAGIAGLGTSNCWAGVDAPPPQAK